MNSRLAVILSVVIASVTAASAQTPPATTAATTPATAPATQAPEETREQRDARMQWWREARYGMFIHWGLYAVPAGTYEGRQIPGIGEWIMLRAPIPVDTYAAYAKEFNPARFNAEDWVLLAKDAGMKYIVITSKHHDGFAMYASKVSKYNIVDATPFKRDPLKELADACRKHNMKLGFYYSQSQDWHHPGGANYRKDGPWDEKQKGDYDKYLDEIAVPQVREILSNYGPVSVLWYDTPHSMTPARAAKFTPLHKLQPGLIINNRLGGGFRGDTETPEQTIPATGYKDRDWETCMTMNDTWGFKSYDEKWKSRETLLKNLIDIASKGGNYLLNVGPTAEGEIPQPSVERLREIGGWLRLNGEAIYGTSASPFKPEPWGRCTSRKVRDATILYLHVTDWPENGKITVPLRNDIAHAWRLADPERKGLPVTAAGEEGRVITVEGKHEPFTVIAAQIMGDPQVIPQPIRPGKGDELSLALHEASLAGATFRDKKGRTPAQLDFTKDQHTATWSIDAGKGGAYDLVVTYAAEKDLSAELRVDAGDTQHRIRLAQTAGDVSKQTLRLTLPPGKSTVSIRPEAVAAGGFPAIREVKLKPAAADSQPATQP